MEHSNADKLLIHPGETISDLLEERKMTQNDLAFLTNVSQSYTNNVFVGKERISEQFAIMLEQVFDIPKSFWLNLQKNYDDELNSI